MSKVKIFLGAYIDSVNAQDINCYNIAKYIDKDRFEIIAPVKKKKLQIPGVKCVRIYDKWVTRNLGKLILMITCKADIFYLPRVEKVDMLFSRFSRRKIVSSVEIQTVFEGKRYEQFFNKYITDYFCISNFLSNLVIEKWKRKTETIYLGVSCKKKFIERETIRNVISVGSVENRKRPELFLEIASYFPEIKFTMVGDGTLLKQIMECAKEKGITNITFKGKLSNEETITEISKNDILLVTSSYEGLPKVVLEAASVCVPALYFNNYYSIDYIVDGENGFAVSSIDDMEQKLNMLIDNRILYRKMCEKAFELSSKYDWSRLISLYENYFLRFSKLS